MPRTFAPAAGVAAALACAIGLSACGEPGPAETPLAATRDFLTEGIIDGNGFLACSYLTGEEQRAASKRAGEDECRNAFDGTGLTLAGRHIDTVYEVKHLRARATVDGKHAEVWLSRGGDSSEFRLVRADASELAEFEAPDTEWRIASGALPFVPAHAP